MKRIFISYKTEDRDRAGTIVRMLRDADLDIWWDQDIRPGQVWRQSIEENLAEAELCLVLWSAASVGREGQWVKEEAEYAKQAGKYLGVLIDRIAPPFGFAEMQSIHALEWDAAGLAATRVSLLQAIGAFANEPRKTYAPLSDRKPYQPPRPVRKWPKMLFMGCIGIPGLIGIAIAGSLLYLYLFPEKVERIKQSVMDKRAPIETVDVEALRSGSNSYRIVTITGVYPKSAPNSNSGEVYACDLNPDGSIRMSTDMLHYPDQWESRNVVYTRKGESFKVNFTVKEENVKTMRSLHIAFPAEEFAPCAIHTPDLMPLVGKFE